MALADTARLIASLELQDKFSGPAKRAESSIGGLENKVGSLGKIGQTASRGLGSLVGNLTKIAAFTIGAGTTAAVAGIAIAVNAASDLNEEIDKSAVVFGKAAPEVQKFAENASAIGLSSAEALGAAGNFGNMFKTIGFADTKAADMSTTMVQLAADMASFNNEDPSEMLDKLRSGISGEAEPLRRFGILISEATVSEFAYANGIAKTGEKLTEAQKVQARYGVIMRDSAIQQGNFADTSGSLANQQRILKGNLTNTAAVIGTSFLPTISKVLGAVNELFINKQPQIQQFANVLKSALGDAFSNRNIDKGVDKVSAFIDKIATFDASKLKFDIGDDDGGRVANIASSIGGIAEQVKGLPWESIANAAKLLGTGSKALLDAFLGLPPWVQTAVLTGWGLNKLTGGALGGIVGELAKGLVKGVLGINAGVVHINAQTVTGGPGGGTGGGGRGIAGGLAIAAGVGLSAVAVERLLDYGQDTAENTRTLNTQLDTLPKRSASELDDSIARVDGAIVEANKSVVGGLLGLNDAITDKLESERQQLVNLREGVRYADQQNQRVGAAVADRVREVAERTRAGFTDNGAKIARVAGSVDSARGTIASGNATLQQIRDKKSSVQVNVESNTTVSLSASQVALQIQRVTSTVFNTNNRIDEALL